MRVCACVRGRFQQFHGSGFEMKRRAVHQIKQYWHGTQSKGMVPRHVATSHRSRPNGICHALACYRRRRAVISAAAVTALFCPHPHGPASVCVCASVPACVHMPACVHVRAVARLDTRRGSEVFKAHVCTHVCTHVYAHVCAHVYMHVCVSVYAHDVASKSSRPSDVTLTSIAFPPFIPACVYLFLRLLHACIRSWGGEAVPVARPRV